MKLKTIYGTYTINEPELIALLESPTVQRMKNINQYGVTSYRCPYNYTRYDHSIGVMILLRRFGASLNEQIAGLLHDASHTAFSHVGDIVFGHTDEHQSYQDSIHEWFLEQTEIPKILQQFGLSVDAVFHKSGNHRMLEQDLPNICADRFEYNLMGMLGEKLLSQNDIDEILNAITFNDGNWVFTNLTGAQKFAYAQLRLNELTWGDPWNGLGYHLAARALKRALELKLITHDMMHFGNDDQIWQLLRASNDPLIQKATNAILNPQHYYELADHGEFEIKPKFRGIDPWVQTEDGIKRLREIDTQFAHAFEQTKKKLNAGFWAKESNRD
jgi:uncharacterized protein